jgi:hypothetical protein
MQTRTNTSPFRCDHVERVAKHRLECAAMREVTHAKNPKVSLVHGKKESHSKLGDDKLVLVAILGSFSVNWVDALHSGRYSCIIMYVPLGPVIKTALGLNCRPASPSTY